MAGGEDDSGPVEGVGGMASLNSIEGNLRADQVDEEGHCGEDCFLLQVDGDEGLGYFGHKPADRLESVNQVETHVFSINLLYGFRQTRWFN